METPHKTAPTEAVGRTIDGGQEAIMAILAKDTPLWDSGLMGPVSLKVVEIRMERGEGEKTSQTEAVACIIDLIRMRKSCLSGSAAGRT